MNTGPQHNIWYTKLTLDFVFYCIDAMPRYNAEFGYGNGPPVLQGVMCKGFETRLFDCPVTYQAFSTCGHRDDAGVVCQHGM